ncbi:MAG TPA: hypothetical protein VK543_06765 [Puia sp.]|nr:hypothetical protein [Puia sp.]
MNNYFLFVVNYQLINNNSKNRVGAPLKQVYFYVVNKNVVNKKHQNERAREDRL